MGANYFQSHETQCRCGCGMNIKPELLALLNHARQIAGVPFSITSGARCGDRNKKVGGNQNSAHTRGLAVDIAYINSVTKYHILRGLFVAGFKRIGDNTDKSFIHCDIDESLPQNVFFKY